MALTREQLTALVQDYANRYGINPAVAVAQIKRESANFRSDVVYGPFVGGAGERGMSQFTPATWTDWGNGPQTNAYDPDQAMTAWGRYMTWLIARYNGDLWKALAGYNGGPGNVDRNTISSAAQRYATEILAQAGANSQPSTQPGTQSGQTTPSWADYCDADGFCYGEPFTTTTSQPDSIFTNPLIWLAFGALLIFAISD